MNRTLMRAAVGAVGLMTTLLGGCGAEPGQDAFGEQQSVSAASDPLLLDSATTLNLSPTLSSTTKVVDSSLSLTAARRSQIIGKYDPSTQWAGFNSYDAQLAGLADATIQCKGSIHPDDYSGEGGRLEPKFFSFDWRYGKTDYVCPRTGKPPEQIMSLLGGQQVLDQGAYGKYIASTWERTRKSFPRDLIPVCPTWERLEVINAPTKDSVYNTRGRVGKSYSRYVVKSEYCSKKYGDKAGECAISHAKACSAGGGSQWWVKEDPGSSTVYTDPVWWLDEKYYPSTGNPYLTPGYFHAMSYYGALPGSRYGMVARAGEYCSYYYSGYHYLLKLQHVWCSPDWLCLSECR